MRTITATTSVPPSAVSPPITPPNRYPASAASFISFCIVEVFDVASNRYPTAWANDGLAAEIDRPIISGTHAERRALTMLVAPMRFLWPRLRTGQTADESARSRAADQETT